MRRVVLVAVALASGTPTAGVAQLTPPDQAVWGPRFRITPFVGQAPRVSRNERWTVVTQSAPANSDFDVDLGMGLAAGAVLEIRAVERFSIVASGAYISRGATREYSANGGGLFEHPGSTFFVGKVGLGIRLREPVSEMQFRRLSASIFGGPAYIVEMPKADPLARPVFLGRINHVGANFGLETELPLAGRFVALEAAIEDYIVWWNDAESARRADIAAAEDGFLTTTIIETDPSHMVVLRAGLVLRF
jgi:hypothetical protein